LKSERWGVKTVGESKEKSEWAAHASQSVEAREDGFDEPFQRMWNFYPGWCEGAFRERYINGTQLLLAKNGTPRRLLGDPAFSSASLASGKMSV